eukprot:378170_1
MTSTTSVPDGFLENELTAVQELLVEYLTGMAITVIYFTINFTIFGIMSLLAARHILQDRKRAKKVQQAAMEANLAAKNGKKKGKKKDGDDDGDDDSDNGSDEPQEDNEGDNEEASPNDNNTDDNNTTKQQQTTNISADDDHKIQIELQEKTEDIDTEESFCRLWYNQGKDKYETYKDILPHLFDTASDVGAVLEFYTLWTILTNASGLDDRLSIRAVFFASIFIIIFFKTVSAGTLYYITKNPWDILW